MYYDGEDSPLITNPIVDAGVTNADKSDQYAQVAYMNTLNGKVQCILHFFFVFDSKKKKQKKTISCTNL